VGLISGLDIQTLSTSVGDVDASGTDILISLGVMGEYFPTQYLSLFAETGLKIDFIGEDEVNALGGIDANENTSGMSISLGSDVWGGAGFTVWFK
jgi:hypothetical protein